ncbi:SET domain-containing protein-lysine N-methyltransferase [Pantoea sp. App145]|uniref:SET domain-containing protein-lysine N-methyltransferase n=1 Tax=Pantoea sp. App145 TaxID=3071567 RepID=UPI003A81096B
MQPVERLAPSVPSPVPASMNIESALVENVSFIHQANISDTPSINQTINIKKEPLEEEDIHLYHQHRPGNLPVLLHKDDELEALGIKQGPLREELMHVDAENLEISIADKKRLSKKIADSATRQIRNLVKNIQEGKTGDAGADCYHIFSDEEHPELGFGLKAARAIRLGEVLPDLYGGFILRNRTQCDEMYVSSDSYCPTYFFETKGHRPRSKRGFRRKPVNVYSGIAGHLKNTNLALVNTALVQGDKVVPSDKNNLIAIRAGENIIVYMAIRDIKKDESLLINYGSRYRIMKHHPPIVKTEPDSISVGDGQPEGLPSGLSWLADNIGNADSWVDASFEVLPQLIALSESFRKQNALLVITKKEHEDDEKQRGDMVVSVIDSSNGEFVDHKEIINSDRHLAVIQYVPNENHYNAVWSPAGNVHFTLVENIYRLSTEKCRVQPIGKTGFCMTDAAAFALFKGRKDKTLAGKPLTDTMLTGIYGHDLREDIKNLIKILPQKNKQLTEDLEKKIQSIKFFEKNRVSEDDQVSQGTEIDSSDDSSVKEKIPSQKKGRITADLLRQFKKLPRKERNRRRFIKKNQLVPVTAMKYIYEDGKLTLRGKQKIQLDEGHKFSNPKEAINEWLNKTEEERAIPGARETLAIKYNVLFETLDSVLRRSGVNTRGLKSLQRIESYARNQIEEKNHVQPGHMKELHGMLMQNNSELSQEAVHAFCIKNNLDESKLPYFFKDNKFTARGRAVLNRQQGQDDRITADLIREWMALGDVRKNYGTKTTFCERNNISRHTLQVYATADDLKEAGEKIMQVEQQNEEMMAAMVKWAALTQEQRNGNRSIEKFSREYKVSYEPFRQKVMVKNVFKDKGRKFLIERGMTREEINALIAQSGGNLNPSSYKKITTEIIDGYRISTNEHNQKAFTEYCRKVGFETRRLVRYIGFNGQLTLRGKAKYNKKKPLAGSGK